MAQSSSTLTPLYCITGSPQSSPLSWWGRIGAAVQSLDILLMVSLSRWLEPSLARARVFDFLLGVPEEYLEDLLPNLMLCSAGLIEKDHHAGIVGGFLPQEVHRSAPRSSACPVETFHGRLGSRSDLCCFFRGQRFEMPPRSPLRQEQRVPSLFGIFELALGESDLLQGLFQQRDSLLVRQCQIRVPPGNIALVFNLRRFVLEQDLDVFGPRFRHVPAADGPEEVQQPSRFRSAFKHWPNKGSPASFAFCAATFTASWIIVINKALIGLAAAASLIGLAAAAAGDSRLS